MLTLIEKVLLLQNIDLLSDVTSEQLSFLGAISQEVTVPAGRVIYREKDAPDGLYVIIDGAVLMRRGANEIDRVGRNGAFGVWALFDGEPRITTAETVEATRVLFISRDAFYEALSDHVDIVEGILKHLVHRLRKLAALTQG